MKYIILLSLIYLSASIKMNLRQSVPLIVTGIYFRINIELNPRSVKAGTFENIAPEAKTIVTPYYANPKADIRLNINHQAIVQKTEQIGTEPVLTHKKILDKSTGMWTEGIDIVNQRIFATTTNVGNVNTFHNVKIDLITGKAIKHVQEGEKKTFGI